MKKLLLIILTLLSMQLQAQCWKEVAIGNFHTVAIQENGSLWSWGRNSEGQAGTGSNLEKYESPVQVGTALDWKKISAGSDFVIAQKNDGTLWGWGNNSFGQLGLTSGIIKTPIQIVPGTDWKEFSCGEFHIIALKNDGTMWSWGSDENNQLGNGSTANSSNTPIHIGVDSTWKTISAGHSSGLAIKSDGTLWSWGVLLNTYEFEDIPGSKIPLQVEFYTDWKYISCGYYYALAIRENGTLWSWGRNSEGQLGNGNNNGNFLFSRPEQVGTGTWLTAHAGLYSSHAIKSDGSLWAWGTNTEGSFGNDLTSSSYSPTAIPQQNVIKIAKGIRNYTGFINNENILKMCGKSASGCLASNITGNIPTPTTVVCSTASLNENILNTISVYPNPTSGILNIENTNNLNIEKLTVIDVTGKILLEQKNNTSQIDVQRLPAGMYILEITANGAKQHTKFIKE